MTRSTFRLVAGFILGFLLLSLVSAAPSLPPGVVGRGALGLLLVLTAGGLAWRLARRWHARRLEASVPRLREVVRRAADSGEQVSSIARRTRLSQDVIRGLIEAEMAPPVLPAGSSIRARQARSGAAACARPRPARGSHYRVRG